MRIEVIKQIDPETREVYKFNTFDFNLVFIGWSLEKKHKGKRTWNYVDVWDKYLRASDFNLEPNLPDEIREQAEKEVAKKIRVMTWDEWKLKNS